MVSGIEFRKGRLFGPSPHSHSVFLDLSSPSFSLGGGAEYLSMGVPRSRSSGAAPPAPQEERRTAVD